MNRTQIVLAGTLALQLVLILVFRSPFAGAATAAQPMLLLPMLEAMSPVKVELHDDEGQSLTLARDGESWTIEELEGFPADATKVDELIASLRELEVRRPVVTASRYHGAFKVAEDEHEARVRVWDQGDDGPDVELWVGSSANYRTTHVRRDDQGEVYEVQGLAPYDVRPDSGSWIRKELADVDEPAVTRVMLDNAQGRLVAEKRDDTWQVVEPAARAGTELDTEKVEGLIRQATTARLADGVGPVDTDSHGLEPPAASLSLAWGGDDAAGEVTLRVGSAVPDASTQRYVTAGSGFTGTIWESSIRRILDDGLEQLVASEPDEADG